MKKSDPKRKAQNRKSTRQKAAPATAEPARRDVLKLLRNVTLGSAALGAGGWWALGAVRATAAEHDLTRIGQGKPVVVQVHDPQCPVCLRLQRETRSALSCFEECDIVYLVANIRSDEGRAFASQHRVPHVTLVTFDAEGTVQHVLRGERPSAEIKDVLSGLRT